MRRAVTRPVNRNVHVRAAPRGHHSLCINEACQHRCNGPDWNVPDPAGQSIDRVRAIRDEIERRVLVLLTEVGVRA